MAYSDKPQSDLMRNCESLISKIPGIFSANVLINEENQVSDIHILAGSRRNAKQISRDVQSALAAAFKMEVDHRVISIAQIDSDRFGGVASGDGIRDVRLRYTGMNVSMHEGMRTYQVCLMREDSPFVGEAECVNSPRQRRVAVAQATIQALEKALGAQGKLSLVMVHMLELEGIPVMLSVVECPSFADGRLLVGAAHCAKNDDEAEAVVRSTLDALNRFCGRFAVTVR